MHEGINSRALNAYVEIIFDNSDSRIMVSRMNHPCVILVLS